MRSNGHAPGRFGDQGDQELLVFEDAEPPGQLASESGAISVPVDEDARHLELPPRRVVLDAAAELRDRQLVTVRSSHDGGAHARGLPRLTLARRRYSPDGTAAPESPVVPVAWD